MPKEKKFELNVQKTLPDVPSYNDLVIFCLSRKGIVINQQTYSELPQELRLLFKEKE